MPPVMMPASAANEPSDSVDTPDNPCPTVQPSEREARAPQPAASPPSLRGRHRSSIDDATSPSHRGAPGGTEPQAHHRATAPRSVSLVRRIKGQGWEKPLLHLLVPSAALRKSLRIHLLRINETSRVDIVLSQDEKRRLVELFRTENARLATFLGRDLGHWSAEPKGSELGP